MASSTSTQTLNKDVVSFLAHMVDSMSAVTPESTLAQSEPDAFADICEADTVEDALASARAGFDKIIKERWAEEYVYVMECVGNSSTMDVPLFQEEYPMSEEEEDDEE